jgi:hypothetical protein
MIRGFFECANLSQFAYGRCFRNDECQSFAGGRVVRSRRTIGGGWALAMFQINWLSSLAPIVPLPVRRQTSLHTRNVVGGQSCLRRGDHCALDRRELGRQAGKIHDAGGNHDPARPHCFTGRRGQFEESGRLLEAQYFSRVNLPSGSYRSEAKPSDFKCIPRGMWCDQERIGDPKIRTLRLLSRKCAASDNP